MKFKKINPKKIESITTCKCGAITVDIEGESYSMTPDSFKSIFGFEVIADGFWVSCNHCVNHWGVDLCMCGSGEAYDKCEEGFNECGKPMQVIGVRTHN